MTTTVCIVDDKSEVVVRRVDKHIVVFLNDIAPSNVKHLVVYLNGQTLLHKKLFKERKKQK